MNDISLIEKYGADGKKVKALEYLRKKKNIFDDAEIAKKSVSIDCIGPKK